MPLHFLITSAFEKSRSWLSCQRRQLQGPALRPSIECPAEEMKVDQKTEALT